MSSDTWRKNPYAYIFPYSGTPCPNTSLLLEIIETLFFVLKKLKAVKLFLKMMKGKFTSNFSYKIINSSIKAQIYREEIFNEIRKHPPGKRRSTSEFVLMSEPFE